MSVARVCERVRLAGPSYAGGVAVQSLVASWLRLLGRPATPGRAPSELWQCRPRAYVSAYTWLVRREPLGEVGRPKLMPVASLL